MSSFLEICQRWTELGGGEFGSLSSSESSTIGLYELFVNLDGGHVRLLTSQQSRIVWEFFLYLQASYPDVSMSIETMNSPEDEDEDEDEDVEVEEVIHFCLCE